MKMLIAIDENNGIGYNGGLPWHCSEDLRWFKFMTVNETVIVGRKTFESMIPIVEKADRDYIVVSSMSEEQAELIESKYEVSVCSCIPSYYDDAFICGGKSIYEAALKENLIDTAYISRIKGKFNADTFAPNLIGLKKIAQIKLSDDVYVEKWVK
jgi:dihydrofolate reductase